MKNEWVQPHADDCHFDVPTAPPQELLRITVDGRVFVRDSKSDTWWEVDSTLLLRTLQDRRRH
jgi:hypothetical protein